MIDSAVDYPVMDILKSDSPVQYYIPKYQREYVWGKWNWETLFDDIMENGGGHFLGSIICINHGKDALSTQPLEVVDGQQRLATLSLLYAAIYKWISTQENLIEDQRLELLYLKRRLVLKSDPSALRLEPSYQRYNYQDYRAALQEAGILQDVKVITRAGNRRILQTYRYFLGRLKEQDKHGNSVWKLPEVLNLLEKVNSALLVKIEVNTHSDAFTLFETLNNRGIPLTALDLIKNKLLAVLEKHGHETLDANFEKWNNLLEDLSEDYAIQQRYLRQFYIAFKYKPEVEVKGISRATRSTLIRIYEKLIDERSGWIFKELCDKGKVYNRLINPANELNSNTLETLLKDLEHIGGVASYTFLLYLLCEHAIAPVEIENVLKILVPYFVRRNLTDVPPTRDLDQIFVDLITTCRTDANTQVADLARNYLSDPIRRASDDLFRTKLSGNIYADNVGVVRFILCKLEETQQTREKLTDLWDRDEKGRYIWTVEHIFPQGENIPQSWVNMIADGDKAKAEKYRKSYVHKLGNLTLTGYNSKLGNLSFEEKRERTDRKGRLVGYKNGLYLNRELKTKSRWRIEDIKDRTASLVDEAIRLFTF